MTGITIKILATLLVLGICVFAALHILDTFENPTSHFATYEEMEASGLMQAGWIPRILPRSAYEITETHNLDTSIVRMSFRFRPGDTGIAEEKSDCMEFVKSFIVSDTLPGRIGLPPYQCGL